jgi:hypothetical protein
VQRGPSLRVRGVHLRVFAAHFRRAAAVPPAEPSLLLVLRVAGVYGSFHTKIQ